MVRQSQVRADKTRPYQSAHLLQVQVHLRNLLGFHNVTVDVFLWCHARNQLDDDIKTNQESEAHLALQGAVAFPPAVAFDGCLIETLNGGKYEEDNMT